MLGGERSAGLDTGFRESEGRGCPAHGLACSTEPVHRSLRGLPTNVDLACGSIPAASAPPSITILPASVTHAVPLAANLRPEVRAEAEGVYDDLVGGFAWAIMDSSEAWVAEVDGEIMAVWGLVDEGSLLVPVARPWCMTTPLVERHARHFARESRRITDHWRQRYWRLHNEVDARYAASVRWLEWLGFRVGRPWQDDERGLMWRSFEWQADGGGR